MKSVNFSIVICLYVIVPRFFEDLKKFNNLKYRSFEVLVVCDKKIKLPKVNFPIRLVLTHKERTGVGEKRDVALGAACGKYIAYIDDDAYPDPEWLGNALKDFKDRQIGAVGGPNLTPSEDSFWAKVGGYIYESYFTSGGAQHRFIPKAKRYETELQGVNLIIRQSALEKIGGFNTKLFSGDDTRVCYSIRLLGLKILYDPAVRVFHHRREFPKFHLRQIRTMATHRGYFVKRYPETSLYPIYFLPSILTLVLIVLIIGSFYSMKILLFLLLTLAVSILIGCLSVIRRSGLVMGFITGVGIIITHVVYGLYFLKGLFLVNNLENQI